MHILPSWRVSEQRTTTNHSSTVLVLDKDGFPSAITNDDVTVTHGKLERCTYCQCDVTVTR
jgi:hypothetical protein